ncbi:MAG: phosphonate metabolism protein (transferase hexapeptide repeat family) [Paracoccaceae bacterium]|jgi:phosphonate metabolism protein (transferase hexapeptide repeat family)
MSRLSHTPWIHPTARINDCTLGRYTEVMEGAALTRTSMDDYSYVAGWNDITDTAIGKFANIASHVRINPGNHPHERASLHHFMYRSSLYWDDAEDDQAFFDWRKSNPCTIGHDTWIGHAAVILPGVTVGHGAVVAAGAIVSKDVAPYTIVGGVPAALIKRRHPQALAETLMELAWWDWPHDRIRSALTDFRSLSADAFAAKHG